MSFFPVSHDNRQSAVPVPAGASSGKGLRIALLGYRSHPHVGGQGIYLHYLSKALVEMGHSVEVISGPPYPELDARVRLVKIPSLDLYAHPNPTRALRPRHLLSYADFYEWWSKLSGSFGEPYCFGRRLVSYFKKHKPVYDIVHDNQSLCYGLLDLQKLGYCVLATVHHPITRDRDLALAAATSKGHRWLVNRWYGFLAMQEQVAQKLAHVITVSQQSRADIVEAFKRSAQDVHIIPNGIDTEIFRPLPHVHRQHWRIITTASSDQPIKGLSVLLNALARLREQFSQVQLIVVGKLKEGGSTETELKKLRLENSVQFISGISTEQLVQEYAQASLAVVPSLYEGFGLPAGEALACGVPLICSDGGALPEVVGDAAYKVKAGDVDALVTALAKLLNNDELRKQLSVAGRLHSLQHLSWQVVAEQLTAHYESLIASGAK
jgi:glycosyltransferase involved in cell wall biosynthesis